MNNNSDNKDILYDIIGGFEDELIEKAADYKKSSKILPFPVYRYVNVAAAFLICIISAVVFVQLRPVNELNETLIIPTNQPRQTASPVAETAAPTDGTMSETEQPTAGPIEETAVPTARPVTVPTAPVTTSTAPVVVLDAQTAAPEVPEATPTVRPAVTVPTAPPIVTAAPTKKPVVTVPTAPPIVTAAPTKKPVVTVPTAPPIVTAAPTKMPVVVTTTPTKTPVVTAAPTKKPVVTVPTAPPIVTATPTNKPVVIVPTAPPVVTVAPTNTPPVVTVAPTSTPPVITVAPTSTPPVITVAPTNTPPVITVAPTNTPGPTNPPPIGTPLPTDVPPLVTPEITNVPTATPKPTAPPLNIKDCTAVEGYEVTIKELNGASYDEENKIIEFTNKSVKNQLGVEIVNPIAGDEEMLSDYGYLMDVDTKGLLNAFHLTGSKLGWGTDREKLPVSEEQLRNGIDKRIYSLFYTDTSTVYYPRPENKVGFSISFWAYTSRKKESGPAISFINGSQCIVATINGNVDYVDTDNSLNYFTADSSNYSRQKEWHYYTITYANDWVTYYVDGVEVPYSNVQLETSYIKAFNDGFLTRYNPTITWTEEDYENDWRGYLTKQREKYEYSNCLTKMKYTVMNVNRYRGGNNSKKILLNFMASPDTQVVLGGGKLGYNHSIAAFTNNEGTKFAQVKYYKVELTNKNVYANYWEALKSKPN